MLEKRILAFAFVNNQRPSEIHILEAKSTNLKSSIKMAVCIMWTYPGIDETFEF